MFCAASPSDFDLNYNLYNFNVNFNNDGQFQYSPGSSSALLQSSSSSPALTMSGPSAQNQPGRPNTAINLPAQPSFRAPAHKHAHHLHSIPPREKSTRTLIIDHMLWVHGRTRFAQARAELGMTDRTGGQAYPNYMHRKRPESYDEDDEVGSEGEDVEVLLAGPSTSHEESLISNQDLSLARSLRVRAEGLEKVVISMLEQPPRVIHPFEDDDVLVSFGASTSNSGGAPPASPKPIRSTTTSHPHILPNGVRLRLALGALINDLFARQAPALAYRQTRQQKRRKGPNKNDFSKLASISGGFAPQIQNDYLDYSLSLPPDMQPSFPQPMPHPSERTLTFYAQRADPRSANSPHAFRCSRHLHTACPICVSVAGNAPSGLGSRSRSSSNTQYTSTSWGSRTGGNFNLGGRGGISGWQDGAGIGAGLMQPGVRGSALRRKSISGEEPEGKTAKDESSRKGKRKGKSKGQLDKGKNKNFVQSPPITSASQGPGTTKLSTLIPRFIRLSALVAYELGREARGEEAEVAISPAGAGAVPSSPTLSRTTVPPTASASNFNKGISPSVRILRPSMPIPASTSPTLSNIINQIPSSSSATIPPLPPSSSDSVASSSSPESSLKAKYASSLRPSPAWYMILAGLLTRAVLEGYLSSGWADVSGVKCLLGVGLGLDETRKYADAEIGTGGEGRDQGDSEEVSPNHAESSSDSDASYESESGSEASSYSASTSETSGSDRRDEEDQFSDLNPDELPDLIDAVRILFPSLRNIAIPKSRSRHHHHHHRHHHHHQHHHHHGKQGEAAAVAEDGAGTGVGGKARLDLGLGPGLVTGKSKAEEEYEYEMIQRMRRFFEIPTSTPDCTTHMEDIARQYPAEPVERAALRFCEAVARWRGKPELETYKSKPPLTSNTNVNTGSSPTMMSIESLVHSGSSPLSAPSPNTGRKQVRRKKPSIADYFLPLAPMSMSSPRMDVSVEGSPSAWTTARAANLNLNTNKRFRDVGDEVDSPTAKRMHSS